MYVTYIAAISNMTRTLKQLRGGDEGMTTLLRCTKCGNEWRRD